MSEETVAATHCQINEIRQEMIGELNQLDKKIKTTEQIDYGPDLEAIKRMLRKKVSIDEFLKVEEIALDKASAATVVTLRANLDGLRYSYDQSLVFLAESLRLHLLQNDEQRQIRDKRATQLLNNLNSLIN